MPAQQTDWTAEMALALPDDGQRYEVLDGELVVSPSPTWRHQSVVHRTVVTLHAYVEAHRLGWARSSPADIVVSRRRLLQPDVFVVPDTGGGEPRSWDDVKSLLLAVEVVSPSTARTDRGRKRIIYMDQRVPEYWIVDPDAELVERWRPGDERPEIITGEMEWRPVPDIAPLVIPLADVFEGGGG